MSKRQLYGTRSCPHTSELREDLVWRGLDFEEFDVEADAEALKKMLKLTEGNRRVPVLVEEGRVVQVGWQGRTCPV